MSQSNSKNIVHVEYSAIKTLESGNGNIVVVDSAVVSESINVREGNEIVGDAVATANASVGMVKVTNLSQYDVWFALGTAPTTANTSSVRVLKGRDEFVGSCDVNYKIAVMQVS